MEGVGEGRLLLAPVALLANPLFSIWPSFGPADALFALDSYPTPEGGLSPRWRGWKIAGRAQHVSSHCAEARPAGTLPPATGWHPLPHCSELHSCLLIKACRSNLSLHSGRQPARHSFPANGASQPSPPAHTCRAQDQSAGCQPPRPVGRLHLLCDHHNDHSGERCLRAGLMRRRARDKCRSGPCPMHPQGRGWGCRWGAESGSTRIHSNSIWRRFDFRNAPTAIQISLADRVTATSPPRPPRSSWWRSATWPPPSSTLGKPASLATLHALRPWLVVAGSCE